jgi:hypothetical protein
MTSFFSVCEPREVSINIHCRPSDVYQETICIADESAQQKKKRQNVDKNPGWQKVSPKARLLKLSAMIGGVVSLRGQITNPFVRCDAIEDCSRCIIDLSNGEEKTTFGQFATLFSELPSRFLGEGESAKVCAVDFCGRNFAVKVSCTDESRDELAKCQKIFKLWATEPRIASFVTDTLLGVKKPVLARCPNFVAQFGYEYAHTIPLHKEDQIMSYYMKKQCAVVSLHEVFDLGDIKNVCKNSSADNAPFFKNERFAFSYIAQILIAIACLQTIGVSHNDLRRDNIFAHSTDGKVLRYRFPSDVPFDDKAVLSINTQGMLFAIADFGVASCMLWEKSGDMRFDEPNLEYGHHATLGMYYFGDVHRIARKPLMRCVTAVEELTHPLRCDLDTRERDISMFLTEITQECAGYENSKVKLYAEAVLREFDVVGRLSSAKQIMEITRRVLSLDFVAQHFDEEVARSFYCNTEPAVCEHVYMLPNEFDGNFYERELEKLLQQDCEYDTLFRLSKNIVIKK